MIEPIKPEDIIGKNIPDEVLDVINDLIKKNFNGTMSTVFQDNILEELYERYGIERKYVFDNHFLNIESIYEEYWYVTYDKPGYNETYRARFEFRQK